MRMSIDFTNKLLDFLFRSQPLTLNNELYIGLFTTAPNSSVSSGTEVSVDEYHRMPIERSLFGFCGTQGSGTTDPSSGLSGMISNNDVVQWPAPTVDWGTVVGFAIFNQETGTEQPYIFYADLVTPVEVLKDGPSVSFPVASIQISLATRS